MGGERIDTVLRRAKADLSVVEPGGKADSLLWEHSLRVMKAAELIASLCFPHPSPIDLTAVRVAALYHDAGWAVQTRDGTVSREEILSRPTSPAQRVLAAELLERRLGDHVPHPSLQKAIRVIRGLNDRQQSSPEGEVVAEAETLDQIGVLSLWPTIRRQLVEGKDIQSFLEGWRRQQEYNFWEARINETLHFEPIRNLARRRLQKFSELISEVARLQACGDLEEALKAADRPAR